MNRAAKVLIAINGVLATLALNPGVQSAIAGFAVHHPFLLVFGASLSSIGHLLTDSRKQAGVS
ncbi:MAG: hypothetical protein DMG65_21055 [Candidatus Angelobacter sp. Gp1-AA117]|nr:MAG: hypothetical protein DMG65_21055 [Candidatus Angelobacter sp. Gp1-AA117]